MSGGLHQYRSFFVILVLVSLVWFVADMLSKRTYQTSVRLVFTGVDTSRYVVATNDMVANIVVESDGFTALYHYLSSERQTLNIDASAYRAKKTHSRRLRVSIPSSDCVEQVQRNVSAVGECSVRFVKDSFSVVLCERESRAYVPLLRDVEFEFPDGLGPTGVSRISPDTVYL